MEGPQSSQYLFTQEELAEALRFLGDDETKDESATESQRNDDSDGNNNDHIESSGPIETGRERVYLPLLPLLNLSTLLRKKNWLKFFLRKTRMTWPIVVKLIRTRQVHRPYRLNRILWHKVSWNSYKVCLCLYHPPKPHRKTIRRPIFLPCKKLNELASLKRL